MSVVKQMITLANALGGDGESTIMAGVTKIEQLRAALKIAADRLDYEGFPIEAGEAREALK